METLGQCEEMGYFSVLNSVQQLGHRRRVRILWLCLWSAALVVCVSQPVHSPQTSNAALKRPTLQELRRQNLKQAAELSELSAVASKLDAKRAEQETAIKSLLAEFNGTRPSASELEALRSRRNSLERRVVELNSTVHKQRSRDELWKAETLRRAGEAVEGLAEVPAFESERRLANGQCSELSGPRLNVTGVCSCTSDVIIDQRSSVERLDSLNTTLSTLSNASFAAGPCDGVVHWAPVIVGSVVDPFMLDSASAIAISPDGKMAYIGAMSALTVVDVSEPAKPVVVGGLAASSRSIFDFKDCVLSPDGTLLYCVSMQLSKVVIFDVATNPTSPAVVGSLESLSFMLLPVSIKLSRDGQFAFVAAHQSNALVVVDVTDPESPVAVGKVIDGTLLKAPFGVSISPDGQLAYVTAFRSHLLTVVDVSDVTNPSIVANTDPDTANSRYPTGVTLSENGQYAYVISSTALEVVDVGTDPSNVSVVGRLSDSAFSMGRHVTVGGGFVFATSDGGEVASAVNVSDPTRPTLVGTISADDRFRSPYGIAVSNDGKFVYATGASSDSFVILRYWIHFCHPPVV